MRSRSRRAWDAGCSGGGEGAKQPVGIRSYDSLIALGIGLLILTLYLSTRSFRYTTDGTKVLWCLRDWMEGGPVDLLRTFNYHYILYCLLVVSLMRFSHLTNCGVDIATLGIAMQSLMGAATVSCIYLFLRALHLSRTRAIVFSLLTASSFAFWNYSVELEHHIHAWLCMVLALREAFEMCGTLHGRHAFLFGLFYGLTMAGHIIFSFAFPLTLIFFAQITMTGRRLRLASIYLCALAGTVGVLFCGPALFIRGISPLILFKEGHTEYFLFNPGTSIYLMARGCLGILLLPIAHTPLIGAKLRSGTIDAPVILFLASVALAVSFGIRVLYALLTRYRSYDDPIRTLIKFLALWIAFYAPFCSFYAPYDVEKFWGIILIPACILAGIAYSDGAGGMPLFPSVLLVFTFSANLFSAFLPAHDSRTVAQWMYVETVREAVPPGRETSVVTVTRQEASGVRLFAGVRAVDACNLVSWDALPGWLAQGTVYVDLRVFDEETEPYYRSRGITGEKIRSYLTARARVGKVVQAGKKFRFGLLSPIGR